jgi:hypothetical protein
MVVQWQLVTQQCTCTCCGLVATTLHTARSDMCGMLRTPAMAARSPRPRSASTAEGLSGPSGANTLPSTGSMRKAVCTAELPEDQGGTMHQGWSAWCRDDAAKPLSVNGLARGSFEFNSIQTGGNAGSSASTWWWAWWAWWAWNGAGRKHNKHRSTHPQGAVRRSWRRGCVLRRQGVSSPAHPPRVGVLLHTAAGSAGTQPVA